MYQGITQILFSLFAAVYLCPDINAVCADGSCFSGVPPVWLCALNLRGFWSHAPFPSEKCVLTPDGASSTVNYCGESQMSSCLGSFARPLLKLLPITCSDA